jgi:hypothetical protein
MTDCAMKHLFDERPTRSARRAEDKGVRRNETTLLPVPAPPPNLKFVTTLPVNPT